MNWLYLFVGHYSLLKHKEVKIIGGIKSVEEDLFFNEKQMAHLEEWEIWLEWDECPSVMSE